VELTRTWDAFNQWVDDAPRAAAAAGAALVAAWIVVLIPSTPIELVLAYHYGVAGGFALIYLGKVCGCAVSFGLGRQIQLGRRLAAENKLMRALSLVVSVEPWRICFLVRAAYIPIALKNYGMAALAAPPVPWLVSLLIVETWNSLELVLVAASARSVGDLAGATGHPTGSWHSLLGTLLAASSLVGLGCYGAVATRRALERVQADSDCLSGHGDAGACGVAVGMRPGCRTSVSPPVSGQLTLGPVYDEVPPR
jgi:uncharacterized membrane protein YdjX (TVP38/TMEM64 family)